MRIVACAAFGGAGGYVRKGQVMDWAPITRIIVRYVVGVIVGMDAGAYALAKRKGWTS